MYMRMYMRKHVGVRGKEEEMRVGKGEGGGESWKKNRREREGKRETLNKRQKGKERGRNHDRHTDRHRARETCTCKILRFWRSIPLMVCWLFVT